MLIYVCVVCVTTGQGVAKSFTVCMQQMPLFRETYRNALQSLKNILMLVCWVRKKQQHQAKTEKETKGKGYFF